MDAILAAIGPAEAPGDRSLEALLRVHSPAYLDLLRDAHGEWLAAGREGDAFPYTFPIVGRRPLHLSRIDARLGQHSFDT
ncbi:MAG TPA: histone deacetylase family protein, partial [Sphingomicrobium sp.]|nr:histone deacetylase family protein [Sphingomicrobium sp.]